MTATNLTILTFPDASTMPRLRLRTWRMYYIVLRAPPAVAIGICDFKGPPDVQRMVEVGYSVLPEYQRQGFASEATAALIGAAYRAGAAEVIAARCRTLPPRAA